ncbi:MAG: Co2+/Mg2+ efflux protein ApaG [Proteobacteria bacterium]|jgi:ApaG protein|nr:Co2+/Mg2+ efflux protein ApaG [Pseudomonadota bacterium]MDA0876724.1 Co2+/Mg2+ efflux protein ApaG [Pseudomonadota bacterium]MDA1186434.1 Co2+/Mg2+ efflux protein ApaG [Pseudomonadota bacterium]
MNPPSSPSARLEDSIRISVKTQFLPEESSQDDQIYSFAYTVTIRNEGPLPVQLVARHWLIDDAKGQRQEVRGLGVVGHQPLLRPGESFEYTSGARLGSPVGSMQGSYFLITEDAHWFEAPIAIFSLQAEPQSGRPGQHLH